MRFSIPLLAVATESDGRHIARFGHGNLLFAIDAAGKRTPREAEGCCGNLAKLLADCEIVVCTEIGGGAAAHLEEIGVRVLLVDAGMTIDQAITAHRAGRLHGKGARPAGVLATPGAS